MLFHTNAFQAALSFNDKSLSATILPTHRHIDWRESILAFAKRVIGDQPNSKFERDLFGILNTFACLCFCFPKNGYPGKERASKDTQAQVIILVLEMYFGYQFILSWISINRFTYYFI